MATLGTINNKPAVLRRVTSSNDKSLITFANVVQGQLDTYNPRSFTTTSSSLSRINIALGGIVQLSKVGGNVYHSSITTVKDNNLTGAATTKVLDIYGRVVKVTGSNIIVDKATSGSPKFGVTATTFDADNAPGNLTKAGNDGLTYYVRMTGGFAPTTQTVGDSLAS